MSQLAKSTFSVWDIPVRGGGRRVVLVMEAVSGSFAAGLIASRGLLNRPINPLAEGMTDVAGSSGAADSPPSFPEPSFAGAPAAGLSAPSFAFEDGPPKRGIHSERGFDKRPATLSGNSATTLAGLILSSINVASAEACSPAWKRATASRLFTNVVRRSYEKREK